VDGAFYARLAAPLATASSAWRRFRPWTARSLGHMAPPLDHRGAATLSRGAAGTIDGHWVPFYRASMDRERLRGLLGCL